MSTEPYAKIGQFAHLEVIETGQFGAFLDVGTDKDLLLPFREQTRDLYVGDWVIVFLFEDSSGRDCASMRTDRHIENESAADYQEGDRVDLLIANRTDMGFRAIIEDRFYGMIYANEVFQPLRIGQRLEGYIKQVRFDGKIDLRLQRTGHRDAEDIGEKILAAIEEEGDFLPMHDKTTAEDIYDRFGVSKKKFKMAIGGLLRAGRIGLEEDGIRRID